MSEHVSMSKRNDPGEREGVTDNQSNKVPEKAGQDRLQGTGGRSGLGQRRDTSSPGMGGGTKMRQGSESRHVGLNFSVR